MSDRLHLATRKGVFTVDRGPRGWAVSDGQFLADNSPMLLHDARSRTMWVALEHGHFGSKMHRSRDDGRSWDEIAVPRYPKRDPDAEPEKDQFGGILPDSLKLIWSLETGGPDQDGRLWCGTIPGGLFRSDDHGDSWQLVDSLWNEPGRKKWFGGGADWPGIHSIVVDPRDPRRVLVGVSCGGVWETRDDGATWKNRAHGMRADYMPPEQAGDVDIQDPHRVVQAPNDPTKFWAQHHNGIFRSSDDCASWQEIHDVSPSTFGFGVVVHPDDGETAWVVPAQSDEKRIPVDGRVVVNRTRDGGASWETLTNGLPQEHSYDLVFRHALDIDESGNQLAFGSTTGSLWISEDQGDSWACVSTHLPPIYALRFVKMA